MVIHKHNINGVPCKDCTLNTKPNPDPNPETNPLFASTFCGGIMYEFGQLTDFRQHSSKTKDSAMHLFQAMKRGHIVYQAANIAKQIHNETPPSQTTFWYVGVRHSDMVVIPCRQWVWTALRTDVTQRQLFRGLFWYRCRKNMSARI